jgi:hypothetical protein
MKQEFYDNDLREEMERGGRYAHAIEVMDSKYSELSDTIANDELAKATLIRTGNHAIGFGKAMAKLMHERHAEDGNLVPALMGYVEAKSLALNLIELLRSDPSEAVRFLATRYTIPLNTMLYESVQQELMDDELAGLDG